MGLNHERAFFAKKAGMLFRSNANEEHSMITFIALKENGSWQKAQEGITMKLSLIELLMLSKLSKTQKFSIVHKYTPKGGAERSTSLNISYSAATDQFKESFLATMEVAGQRKVTVPINMNDYTVFIMLLAHLMKEKVELATCPQPKKATAPAAEQADAPPQEEEVVAEPPDYDLPMPEV